MQRFTWRIAAAVAVLVAAGLAWHATWAQATREPAKAPEVFLPADSIAYVRYDGTAKHRTAWEQTAAYESVVKSGLWKALEDWVVALSKQQPQAEQAVAQVLPMLQHIIQEGASAAANLTVTGGQVEAQLTVVVHNGAAKHGPTIIGLLKQADPQAREQTVQGRTVLRGQPGAASPIEWGCWTDGGHLVLSIGRDAINATLNRASGKADDIRKSALWTKSNVAPRDIALMTVAWFDLERVNKVLKDIPLPEDPTLKPTPTIGDMLGIWGLNNLQDLVLQSGAQGKACWSETRLRWTGARRGLMKLAETKAFTLADLPPMPENCGGFSAAALNWLAVYDEGWNNARDFAQKHGLGASFQKVEDDWKNLQAAQKISLRDDVLATLGQIHAFYGDPAGGISGVGMGLTVQVTDAPKLRKTINRLMELIPQGVPNLPQIVRSTKQGQEVISVGQPGIPVWPSICIDDNWLLISTSPQGIDSFLLRKQGKLPTWKPNAEVATVLKAWPQKLQSVSVNDPKAMVLGIGQAAPFMINALMAAQAQAGGRAAGLPTVDFPSAELVAQPLFANVSIATVEDGLIVLTSRTSLPVMGGGDASSVAVVGVLVALLLPAVQQARMAARRTQSRNNLKQIGLALHNYHDTFNQFPQGTVTGPPKPEDRLSWQASILPYLDQAPLYNQLDMKQGWQATKNQPLGKNAIPTYSNPNLPIQQNMASYVGIAGLGADGPKKKLDDKGAGMFAYDRATKLRDVTDGLSNTLMVGEVSKDRGPWIQGGPATIRPLAQKPYINGPDGFGGLWNGGTHFLLGDGSVRFFSENIDPKIMESLTTIRGGEQVGNF